MTRTGRFLAGLALLAALGATWHLGSRVLAVGAAYKAKVLCSAVFVSKRPAASVLREDFPTDGDPLYRLLQSIEATVDASGKSVSARAPLALATRTAWYRPTLGCTLADAPVPVPALTGQRPTGTGASPGALWPRGDRVTPIEADTPRGRMLDAVLGAALAEPVPGRPRRTRAVVVVHRGRVVAERYAPGFSPGMPLPGWSMTKSVVNALTGILVARGDLYPDSPVPVPEWRPDHDPRATITLDQLLRMSSGLDFSEAYGNPLSDVVTMLFRSADAGGFAAARPLAAAPGTRWAYASGTTNIITRSMREALGEDPRQYLSFPRAALFEPLGMRTAVLEPDAAGNFVGSSFMYASARDWARFGLLYLRDGVWDGVRLLPEGWVNYTRTPAPAAAGANYGAHFWLKLDGETGPAVGRKDLPGDAFHAAGYGGQYLSIVPSLDLVVVRLGLSRPGSWNQAAFVASVADALTH